MGTSSGDAAHEPMKDEGGTDSTAQATSQNADTAPSKSGRINWNKWLLGSGIAAAVISVLLTQALPPLWRHFFSHAPVPGPVLTLAANPIVMSCAQTRSCYAASATGVPLGPETVDFTVQRNSSQNVAINYARIKVQRFTTLSMPSITSLIIIKIDHRFHVPMLPRFDRRPKYIALHEGVTANNPFARIELEFIPPGVHGRIFLYRVDIALIYTGGPVLNVGEALISVPADPPVTDKCSRNDNSGFCRLLRLSGSRDAVLNQLSP